MWRFENTGVLWLHFAAVLIERIQNAFDRLSGLQHIAWFSRWRRQVARLKTFRGLAASRAALKGKDDGHLSASIISLYIFGSWWYVIELKWWGCWIADFLGLRWFMLRSAGSSLLLTFRFLPMSYVQLLSLWEEDSESHSQLFKFFFLCQQWTRGLRIT